MLYLKFSEYFAFCTCALIRKVMVCELVLPHLMLYCSSQNSKEVVVHVLLKKCTTRIQQPEKAPNITTLTDLHLDTFNKISLLASQYLFSNHVTKELYILCSTSYAQILVIAIANVTVYLESKMHWNTTFIHSSSSENFDMLLKSK